MKTRGYPGRFDRGSETPIGRHFGLTSPANLHGAGPLEAPRRVLRERRIGHIHLAQLMGSPRPERRNAATVSTAPAGGDTSMNDTRRQDLEDI
jgi:hypothetical protein